MKETILRHITAEDIARAYNFELPKKNNGNIRCPFGDREDKHPSFTIRLEDFFWHDKTTGEGGDCFSFIARKEGLDIKHDFRKILKIAGRIAGVNTKKDIVEIPIERYEDFWLCAEKEIRKETVVAYNKKHDINLSKLNEEIRQKGTNDFYLKLYDSNGRFIGCQTGNKYVAKGSSLGFLYNKLDYDKDVYFVEGVSDYLTAKTQGLENTVGIVSLGIDKVEVLKMINKFKKKVHILFDVDTVSKEVGKKPSFAGLKFSIELKKSIKSSNVFFYATENGEDLNDLHKGKTNIVEIINTSSIKRFTYLADSIKNKTIAKDFLSMATAICTENSVAIVGKTYWLCINGIWKQVEEAFIKGKIISYFDKCGEPHTQPLIQKVLFYIEIIASDNSDIIKSTLLGTGEFLRKNVDYVFTKTAKVNIKTLKQEEIKPSDGVISCLNINSSMEKKESGCPLFLGFLDSIFQNDKDKEERIEFMRQWIGYCFYNRVPLQSFLYIIGKGGNGKGVLLSVIEDILGIENVVNIQLKELISDGHRTASLLGAYANLISDAEKTTKLDNSILKQVTGDDVITINPKNKQAVSIKPFSKFIIASNYEPIISESADWLKRRLFIISFNKSFTGKEVDIELKTKLSDEKNEIFWWALGGLKTLLAKKMFTIPPSVKKRTKMFLQNCDIVSSFMHNGYEHPFNGKIKISDLYDDFRDFCIKEGLSIRYIPLRKTFISRFVYLMEGSKIERNYFVPSASEKDLPF